MAWTRTTPKGREVTFYQAEPTHADLVEHDAYMDDMEAAGAFDAPEEPFEDPDSDGYGWERQALRKAWL